jgi:hypothetical protein
MIIARVADAIDRLDEEAINLVGDALAAGEDPLALIEAGIGTGVRRCGDKLAAYEYGVPELLVAGEMLRKVRVVRALPGPGYRVQPPSSSHVQGDIHELGKNLIALLGVGRVPGRPGGMWSCGDHRRGRAPAAVIGSLRSWSTMPAQQEVITYPRYR